MAYHWISTTNSFQSKEDAVQYVSGSLQNSLLDSPLIITISPGSLEDFSVITVTAAWWVDIETEPSLDE